MDASSFALHDFRKKNWDKEVWVPLRAAITHREGTWGREGYLDTSYASTSVAVPLDNIEAASKKLDWLSMGLIRDHRGRVQDSVYHPADLFEDDGFTGVNLVVAQGPSNSEPGV